MTALPGGVRTGTSLTLQTEDMVYGLFTDGVDTLRAPYLVAKLGRVWVFLS